MLRARTLNFGGFWDVKLDLMKISYDKRYHPRMWMTPFETLYGHSCRRSLVCWDDSSDVVAVGHL